jgi:hypothetical protein
MTKVIRWRAVAHADALWRPLVYRTFGRADEAELRRQSGAGEDEDDAAMVGGSDILWKTVYRGLIAEALPVRAVLKDKVRSKGA